MNKTRSDASNSVRGTLYQFYLALDWCFDLQEGDHVVIEKFADIAFISKDNLSQSVEVKHYAEYLTDKHKNLWNSLRNWCDESFALSAYDELILTTTQKFGPESTLKEWNSWDASRRLEELEKIYVGVQDKAKLSKVDQTICELFLPENKFKLTHIVKKLKFVTGKEGAHEFFINLKEKHLRTFPNNNLERVLDSLVGWLIRKDVREGGWDINSADLNHELGVLQIAYGFQSKQFPRAGRVDELPPNVNYDEHLFVKKIQDIEYVEVIEKATIDYYNALNLISMEFSVGQQEEAFNQFNGEIISSFEPAHRLAKRNSQPGGAMTNAKNLYDLVTGETPPPFQGFESVDMKFRNGSLHYLMNDRVDLKWSLNDEDD